MIVRELIDELNKQSPEAIVKIDNYYVNHLQPLPIKKIDSWDTTFGEVKPKRINEVVIYY